MYAYRLKSTKAGSEKFGTCEVCGKTIGIVYILVIFKVFFRSEKMMKILNTNSPHGLSEISTTFGCKDCLSDLTNHH
jgi:hypothetical protein